MFPGMSTPLLILGIVQLTKLYFYGVHIVVAVLYEATHFETISIFLLLVNSFFGGGILCSTSLGATTKVNIF